LPGIENGMDALNRKQALARLAHIHADEWKQASKTDAEITKARVSQGIRGGSSREEVLDLAADTLKYMRRHF
jgi:hypothetical protein